MAVAETALPAGRILPGAGEATVRKVEQLVDRLPSPLQRGIGGLLRAVEVAAWLGERRPFARLSPARRLAVLDGWRTADPLRGIRDIEAVEALAQAAGLVRIDDRAMPANNRCLTWQRRR